MVKNPEFERKIARRANGEFDFNTRGGRPTSLQDNGVTYDDPDEARHPMLVEREKVMDAMGALASGRLEQFDDIEDESPENAFAVYMAYGESQEKLFGKENLRGTSDESIDWAVNDYNYLYRRNLDPQIIKDYRDIYGDAFEQNKFERENPDYAAILQAAAGSEYSPKETDLNQVDHAVERCNEMRHQTWAPFFRDPWPVDEETQTKAEKYLDSVDREDASEQADEWLNCEDKPDDDGSEYERRADAYANALTRKYGLGTIPREALEQIRSTMADRARLADAGNVSLSLEYENTFRDYADFLRSL